MIRNTSRLTTLSAGAGTDTFSWTNPYGGFWGIAFDWQDTTVGALAINAPGASSTVNITGGIGDTFTNINGAGAAAQLSISQDVLLWGSVAVGGAVSLAGSASATTELDLDGGAFLSAGTVNLGAGSTLELANASTLLVTGAMQLTNANLLIASRSVVRVGTLISEGIAGLQGLVAGTIAVDTNASMEVGSAGGAALGALTIDQGQTAVISGAIGSDLVINGALAVQAGGKLSIGVAPPFQHGGGISGTGTLVINENSQVTLFASNAPAIQFAGPNGTLILDQPLAGGGIISGFAAGDIIELEQFARSSILSVTQTSPGITTLTMPDNYGFYPGTLTLAGTYTASQFHMRFDSAGNGFISLQTVGSAPVQPATISGTAGADTIIATATNQVLTGFGGSDVLSGGGFAGINFKDTSANLNGDTIALFVASDTIDLTDMRFGSVALTYTPAVFSGNAPPVPAVLAVNDGTHAATISLSTATVLPVGSWAPASDGNGGSLLRYTALNTDAYAFVPSLAGTYGQAGSWQDTTTASAATQAPGSGNGVTLSGGASYTIVSGTGIAASLATSGADLLLGNINVGTATPAVSGALIQSGTLALDGGASVVLAGSAAIGGTIEIGGHSTLTAAGSATFTTSAATLLAINGSILRFGGVVANSATTYAPLLIAVDANSSIEFGTTGSAHAGALTIDSGVTASLGGTIAGNVVVNGTLAASGQALTIAPFGSASPGVSGSGMLEIDSGGVLTLSGADSAAIQFATASTGVLALGTILPTGTISGFARGDAIRLGELVTTTRYSQIGGIGKLTLYSGFSTIGTLTLAGTYTGQLFQVQVAAGGNASTITYAPAPGTAGGAQIVSGTDAYTWTNVTGGVWSNAGNWMDATTNRSTTVAPGSGNVVIIQDNPGSGIPQIISGTGAAASLAVYAPATTVFTGTVAVGGAFWIGYNATGGVSLANGARFSVGALDDYGSLQLAGASTLAVTGGLISSELVGILNVVDGSSMTFNGTPDIGGGTVGIDATSSIEFGAAGGAVSGALTIDAGRTATAEENATIAANLVVNGLLATDNVTIQGFAGAIGSISGTGTLQIGSAIGPGRLTLRASDSVALAFYTGNNTLELAGPLPTAMISNFVAGQTIRIDRTVTGVYSNPTDGNQCILYLYNGPTFLGTLMLAGNYTANRFAIDVAAATGFATISVLPATTSGASGTANGTFDAYTWIGASGGSWADAANWQDTTSNTPNTVPGHNTNPVTLAGTMAIGGNGSTGNLIVNGNLTLTGHVNVSWTVTIGSASDPSASLDISSGAVLITALTTISGTMEVGNSSVAAVYYTATLAGGTLLSMEGSTVQVAALATSGSGNVIAVDTYSIIKVAYPQTAALGALTLAKGSFTTLNASIYGNVVVDGLLQAPTGGSLFVDMTGTAANDPYSATPTLTGAGTLWLAAGSTLGIGAADSVPIQFGGANATLMLATLPTATIYGFAATDQIQVEQAVTGLSFQQNTGVLTLTNGAATVGTLTLAGSYTGSLFHLDASPTSASATITLQTIGLAATQPTLIQGTSGTERLAATANGQTIVGGGGNDTLSGGTFTGLTFKDVTALMNSYTVIGFSASDFLDFTDLNPATAWVTYSGSIVTVYDGAHAANMYLSFGTAPASGSFHIATDGASGSKLTWS